MSTFLALTVAGLATYGCIYALTALGLVVTYTTSGVFNLAQGAVGMMAAFLYWQLSVDLDWPAWMAFVVVVLFIAPLSGAALERFLMRPVERYGVYAQVSVTIGLLLLLIAIATSAWSPTVSRTVPEYFNGRSITVGALTLSWDQLVVLAITAVVAVGLRLFLFRTKAGTATRAVADNRELTALMGSSPAHYARLGWAVGTALAAAAGILIAPLITLNITTLTLIVLNGYAAAVLGRMRSLPLTFAGGLALGLIQSYAVGYLPVGQLWSTVVQIAPMSILLLLLVVMGMPQRGATSPAPSRHLFQQRQLRPTQLVAVGATFLAVATLIAHLLPGGQVETASRSVAIGIILLSLLLLSGYGGMVSLCQLTFAGLGAYAMGTVAAHHGSFLGLVAAVSLPAAAGALFSLVAFRLRGVYMALATLAFAICMDDAFFENTRLFGVSLSLAVPRPDLLDVSLHGERVYLVTLSAVFALVAGGLVALHRGRFGRRIAALSDNPLAGSTLGINAVWSNLILFAASAGLAGLGGALYGGAQGTVGPDDFSFLLSLTVFLLATVWGIRTVAGMLAAGISLALSPVIQSHLSQPPDVVSLFVGLAAIGVARSPQGTFGPRQHRQRRPRPVLPKADPARDEGPRPIA